MSLQGLLEPVARKTGTVAGEASPATRRSRRTKKGGTRILGIPNVVDRMAQTATVLVLEPEAEKVFHDDWNAAKTGQGRG